MREVHIVRSIPDLRVTTRADTRIDRIHHGNVWGCLDLTLEEYQKEQLTVTTCFEYMTRINKQDITCFEYVE